MKVSTSSVLSWVLGSSLLILSTKSAKAQYFQSGESNPCNAGLATIPCVSWASMNFAPENEAEIPCGVCVKVDHDLDVVLPQGINIIGRLWLAPPPDKKIKITTNHVVVQGLLSMHTPYAPGPEPTINFVMTYHNQGHHFFTPFGINSEMCGGSCIAGKRALLVGGGRLDVKGLPEDCKTWTQLERVSTQQATTVDMSSRFIAPTQECPLTLSNYNFESNPSHWYSKGSALFEVLPTGGVANSGFFSVTNRQVRWQGPAFNLVQQVADCIIPNVQYMISYSIRLHSTTGTPSKCSTAGQNCPYWAMNRRVCPTGACRNIHKHIGRATKGVIQADDTWYRASHIVTFTEEDLAPNQYYRYIGMDSVDEGLDIHLDNLEIKRLPSSYFPSDVCSNLVINGGADLDPISPYPFYASDGGFAAVTVMTEGSNNFFRLTGRRARWSSIRYPIKELECLAPEMVFDYSVKARSTKVMHYLARLVFYTKHPDGRNKYNEIRISECASGANTWEECSGTAAMSRPELFEAHEIFLDFYVRTDPTTSMDIDDMSFSFKTGAAGGFVVESNGVEQCWLPGSEVLITPDNMWFETDVRAIIKSTSTSDGFTTLEFEETLSPRASKESMFPVELVLLKRNIKFESDSTELSEGGHMAVWQTQQVQELDGVEFYKFGQQGTLGRYPIHWHMCGSVDPGTIAKRNLVMDSNQRCLVIHGTHNMTIEGNVGYENFGHCYLLEDGGEIDNTFIGNFGSRTKNMNINPPLRGGIDDDDQSSTFWCTNPMNKWIGNVAAGGENTGFWFELEDAVKAPSVAVVEGRPFELPLDTFYNNTAHSYRVHGVKTYTHGYRPYERARFVNTRSYKNHHDGFFFHNSWLLGVYGGVVADNRRQIRIHRADDVVVDGVTVIGQTAWHQEAIKRDSKWGLCPSTWSTILGISIHAFLFRDRNRRGPTLRNIDFSEISDASECELTAAIGVHYDEVEPSFNSWTKLENLNMVSNVDRKFSMCQAIELGVSDVVIEVRDGSLYGQPGVLISDGQPELTGFVDGSQCSRDEDACLLFCANACLHVVRFLVEPSISSNGMTMVVTDQASGRSQVYPMGALTELADSLHYDTHRAYVAALPSGSYDVVFMDGATAVWPTYVMADRVDSPECAAGGTLSLHYPTTPAASECETLISDTVHNGNLELGNPSFWRHIYATSELFSPGGVAPGSHAMRSTRLNRLRLGQWLNVRCLEAGAEYEMTARVRFADADGNWIPCDPRSNGSDRCSYCTILVDYVDENGGLNTHYERVGYAVDRLPTDAADGEWQLIHGIYKVSERVASGYAVFLYVEYGRGHAEVDNLSFTKVNRSNLPIIVNGDFEVGDHRFWPKGWNEPLTMVSPGAGGSAAAVKTDVGRWIHQYIDNGSLIKGDRYLFSAKIKIEGGAEDCNASLWHGATSCPKLVIYSSFTNDVGNEWRGYQITAAPYVPGQWNLMYGYVTITEAQATGDQLRVIIQDGPDDGQIVIDDISLVKTNPSCTELIENGGAETGDARAWLRWRDGVITVSPDGTDGQALVSTQRNGHWQGLTQEFDQRCMVEGTTYNVSGMMKLVNATTGEAHPCTTGSHWGDAACPVIGVQANGDYGRKYLNVYNTLDAAWVADAYNPYTSQFVISNEMANAHVVRLYIERPPAGIDIYVDELTVSIA